MDPTDQDVDEVLFGTVDKGAVLTPAQCRAKYEAQVARLKSECYVEDGYVCLNGGKYDIALNRCDTYPSILWWVHHLSEKIWFDQTIAHRFIEVVVSANGLKMYDGEK